jgi:hypothetical protein
VVVLAAHIVARDPAILSYILSVPVFMLILFLTRLLAGGLERTGVSTPRPLLLLQLQLFFLIAFLTGRKPRERPPCPRSCQARPCPPPRVSSVRQSRARAR